MDKKVYDSLCSTVKHNEVISMDVLNVDKREVKIKHIDGEFFLLDDDVLLPMIPLMKRNDIMLTTKEGIWLVAE